MLGPERRLWDAEARRFDDEPDHGLADPATRAAWRTLLLGVLPGAPARIVDLGCGTGTLSVLLAQEGYDVTGLDFSPAMVARARTKAEAAGVSLDLVVGDANRPGLPTNSFDVVLSRHVLWAMHDPVLALRRWVDLLGPEGLLLLVEGRWHTGAGLTAAETEALVLATGRTAQVRAMSEPVYWGGETGDERYLVVSRRRTQ
ncbi:MAG: methyltransferase domain-containing protein [Actinomycetota bacterium]|nr:methyltransferase domain-containing protein [Actinomycetota bacterium]